MIRGVAFDLEGTMVDVEEAHHRSHIQVASELGLHLDLEHARIEIPGFVGGGDAAVAEELRRMSGTRRTHDWIQRRMKDLYHDNLQFAAVCPREGLLDTLRELAAIGLPLSVGSLTERSEGLWLLQRTGLLEFFGGRPILFRESVERPKPDSAIYRATAQAMGVSEREQLVFEDSPVGIAAARAAGSCPVAVPTIHAAEFRAQLEAAGAVFVLDGWRAMSARAIVELAETRG